MRRFGLTVMLFLVPLGLFAARLTLRDGTVVYGKLISGSPENIVFLDENGSNRRFDVDQIRTIDFDAVSPNQRSATERLRSGSDDRGTTYGAEGRRGQFGTASRSMDDQVLPAGAQISVRTDSEINADTAVEGRTYPATISQDVVAQSGEVLIPRGSEANLVIRDVNEGGALTGGNLVLDLESVRVNGRRYLVSTEDVNKSGNQGIGANRRTGEMVGGGAVLGTLLGAIAGGGKGAAIGAIAGAAAGGGVQVLTKGKEIKVPAETVLNFRLDQPLRLRAE